MKIIGLFPLIGNGGIASWANNFMHTFPNDEFQFSFVDVSSSDNKTSRKNLILRIYTGLKALSRIKKELIANLTRERFDIMHITTSGNIGTLRDLVISRICKKYGVRTIMHCHYGCITEDIQAKGIVGMLLRKAMSTYDQIWVLDTRSYNTLKSFPNIRNKVHLTPNSIKITDPIDYRPKKYSTMAFCGNLIPTKGIYELVRAVTKTNILLHIIGPGTNDVISNIKMLAGDLLNKRIFLHGRLPNQEAVRFLKNVEIIALPTYYPSEAFPISILEAMSLTKLVISTNRAAIPDMLTALDGSKCGIIVKEKSVEDIVNGINYCQTNPKIADEMCKNAYEKVKNAYSTDVVYDLYRSLYKKLV